MLMSTIFSALDALNKCVNLALPSWDGMEKALRTRAEVLLFLQRYSEQFGQNFLDFNLK